MPKKNHKTTNDKKSSRPHSACSQCTTRLFCICDSGHAFYDDECPISDRSGDRHDNGDFASDNKCLKQVRKPKKSRSLNASVPAHKDLASGDHDKCRKTSSVKRKTKSESKIKEKNAQGDDKSSGDDAKVQKDIETILEYQNTNFNDNSSACSISPSSNHEIEEVLDMIEKRVCPRPVVCPVQECGKMIALDAVMLHFYFDHSRVPRMTLNITTTREIKLKPSNFSVDSQCFAVFLSNMTKETILPPQADSTSILASGLQTDNKSLMLMGARIKIEGLKAVRNKNKSIPIRCLHTQTDMVNRKATQKNTMLVNETGGTTTSKSDINDTFHTNEVLLLWLCKLDDNSSSYCITIQRKDKKYGHNYTGDALHIRDNQEASSVYDISEGLIVHGEAANRLLDENHEMCIIINILE